MPLNRPGRNVKQFCDLRFVQSDKKPQFDDFRLFWREHGQFIEGQVYLEKPLVVRRNGDFDGIQINAFAFSAVARAKFPPGAFDENVTHGLGGGGEEMPAVLPAWQSASTQPQPGFMNQRRGLEGLARGLLGHPGRGQTAQLLVNQRQEFFSGLGVALLGRVKNEREVTHYD
jgi:hypothetical protein